MQASSSHIELRDVSHTHARPAEAPYRWFIAGALALALSGGFSLALLLPLASALEWDWGARWRELVQAHGQLQLLGFAGLFVIGMTFRLMPRFSGRPLADRRAIVAVLALVGGGVIIRALAPLGASDGVSRLCLVSGPALTLAGALVFAGIVGQTLLHPDSKAEATAWFLVCGAVGFAAASALSLALAMRAAGDQLRALPAAENNALISLELYGFVLMFIGGISTRAVPTLVGRVRSQAGARVAAVTLAAGAAAHSGATLWSALDEPSKWLSRADNIGLVAIAAAMLMIAWATGVIHPRANRIAAASQRQFWFVRAAVGWLTFSALLTAWYAARALRDGQALDQFETDAVRHALTAGVITMMIAGMAMLVVPEFAGRRLQHTSEGPLIWTIFASLNAAAALRVWPALEGIGWLETTRYWPMATAGALALRSRCSPRCSSRA